MQTMPTQRFYSDLATSCVALVIGMHCLNLLDVSWLTKLVYFTALALAIPVISQRRAGQSCDWIERSMQEVGSSLRSFAMVTLAVIPAYLAVAHVVVTVVAGAALQETLQWNISVRDIAVQVMLIALPEEFFFRGYLQTQLAKVFTARRQWWGAALGWHIPVTAALFAVMHSLVSIQWWHFAIFFPGLLFGFLKARSPGLLAPILMHALCNLLMQWMQGNYG